MIRTIAIISRIDRSDKHDEPMAVRSEGYEDRAEQAANWCRDPGTGIRERDIGDRCRIESISSGLSREARDKLPITCRRKGRE